MSANSGARLNPVATIELDGERFRVQYVVNPEGAYDRVLVDGEPIALGEPRLPARGVVRFALRHRPCALELHSGLFGLRGFSALVEGRRVHAEGSIRMDDPVPAAAFPAAVATDGLQFRGGWQSRRGPALPGWNSESRGAQPLQAAD